MFDRGPGSTSLDAGQFRALADFLDRMTHALDRRAATRTEVSSEVGLVGAALTTTWRSPVAETMASGCSAFTSSLATLTADTAPASRELRALAGEARRTAQVIAEVEQYEKSWNQQLVANWSEWQDRTTTALASWLPGRDDAASKALTEQYHEQTRRTEEASTRRREALARWHAACGSAATALRSAIGAMDGFGATVDLRPLAQPEHATQPLYTDDRMNVDEAIALHALAGNRAAAWAFVWDGSSVRTDAVGTVILLRTTGGTVLDDQGRYADRGGAPAEHRRVAIVDGMRADALAVIDNVFARRRPAWPATATRRPCTRRP